ADDSAPSESGRKRRHFQALRQQKEGAKPRDGSCVKMHMLMPRFIAIAAALTCAAPAFAAEGSEKTAPAAPPAAAPPAAAPAAPVAEKKVRRVHRLSIMKIEGRAMKPQVDVLVSRSRLHFEPGTIQYQFRRKSFERFH
ncbi:MAG TPA: hypothetical protein PKD61_35890, partial [Polyangiaceae bacterium]|nr:hypothetical protein [Polyangiaceae bacterium]